MLSRNMVATQERRAVLCKEYFLEYSAFQDIFPPLLGTSGKDKHSLAYHDNTSCCVKKRVLGTSLLIQALSS